MTPVQLELARWREMQRTARKCRHLAQACRTPVARLVRFDRALSQAWNASLHKLERLNPDNGLGEIDATQTDRVKELSDLVEILQENERDIAKHIARLSARKPKPSKPIEQKIAARKKRKAKEEVRRAKFEVEHAKWERHVRDSAARYLGKLPPEPVRTVLERIEQSAAANTAEVRSDLRFHGWEDVADEFLAMKKKEPKL